MFTLNDPAQTDEVIDDFLARLELPEARLLSQSIHQNSVSDDVSNDSQTSIMFARALYLRLLAEASSDAWLSPLSSASQEDFDAICELVGERERQASLIAELIKTLEEHN